MNYIGSKYSLIDFLVNTIQSSIKYETAENLKFADLFAGTGIVGQTFKSKGYSVIANDFQYYSYILNKHYIENSDEALLDSELLEHLNNLPLSEGFIYNNYCLGSGSNRNYFTDFNGKKCDAIRLELEKLKNNGSINSNTYFYYLASLINSIDKFANTASVYGAFLKHIKKSAQKKFALELLPITKGPVGKVYCADINKLITFVSGDILYLDPPYNARQYSANYHVLETIARYDDPELKGITGLRDCTEQKSLFCSKKTVAAAFEDLISKANYHYIFLSYNNEGLMDLDTIAAIMSKYGKYSYKSQEYHRFKADKDTNRNIKAESTLEYLHCLQKN